ncbi:arabinofuranan 3-O-arabinosyltransferase [Corynebacterium timonense]|uniref:Arabinofuranan 3-O-arabinosyltransferase n=2 Tax=Corynebacterium timonense TaxID=441500 RepID=A0A1H1L651_9CORY|nr:arabinofuranan 3-O-arabinosyltransferase [Corynebacterium timonense]
MCALVFVAVVGVLRACLIAPLSNEGTDFRPIWDAVQRYVDGVPVYNEDYSTHDPHYLYSPGGTVVLAPLALLGTFEVARVAMIAVNAVAIVAALWIVARLAAGPWAAALTLAAVGVFFNAAEPVASTLTYTNINGLLLLVMVVVVWACLVLDTRAHRHHRQFLRPETYLAGVLVAYALTLKPQFVVLAAVPFLLGQWPVLVVAAASYAAVFAVGWATTVNAHWYVERLLPYLAEPRSYDNGSLSPVLEQIGLGETARTVVIVLLLALVGAAVAAMFPLRRRDPVVWSFAMLAVLFSGVFLAGGLLQGYYTIWLIPLAMTVLRPATPMHSVGMWVALLMAHGGLSRFFLDGPLGDWPDSTAPTLGWVLVAVVGFAWAVSQVRARRQGGVRHG